MSSKQVKYIPKLNDRDVVRAFQGVAEAHEGLTLRFSDNFGAIANDEEVSAIAELAGNSLVSASLIATGRAWTWNRVGAEATNPHSATHDTLTFAWNPQQWTPQRMDVAPVSAALDIALRRPLASVQSEIPPLAAHSEALLAMESIAANIITEATEHRHELDRTYADKEEALNARVAEDRERELQRLNSERARVEAELSSRQKDIDERQRELDALKGSLDDRNNTHVRRQIRESLLQLAEDRLANFAVSRETRQQYFTVHFVSLLGLVVLSAGSVFYAAQVATSEGATSTTLVLAIKSAALAAAVLALGSWYLGWLNRWLQRIADAEFKLQQFRLDIERASWLAETVLEWKTTSSDPFPDLLATRLSAGLFSSESGISDDPKTPATHLAEALFGAAASVKLKMGDQELFLDRKGIKGLADE